MSATSKTRFRWLIRGQVQGVGFRPFVFRRAVACRLSGLVRNDLHGVCIEAQGLRERLERFDAAVRTEHPSLARIESINRVEIELNPNESFPFRIETSCSQGDSEVAAAVDFAMCDDCLREVLAADDRRAGYILTTCTACGPRYSIVRAMPYDRANTTMAEYGMCGECEREYSSPADRRYHAQPIACPECGPGVDFVDRRGRSMPGDPIENCVRALRDGAIVAIKGIGGFHLAVRASDRDAVALLRRRKRRDAKPLAVMCGSLAEATMLVELGSSATAALLSAARPIVVGRRQLGANVANDVAPGMGRLGVMLPYTPLHHLLFAADPPLGPLVMTSGNLSDEPLTFDNQDALAKLGGLCDFFLTHGRPIQRSIDDSVLLDLGPTAPLPIRRARGYVPGPLTIPRSPPAEFTTGICLGGELKNTIALVRGSEAILSQHLGDLKHPLAFATFRRTIDDLLGLYNAAPRWVAADLHPGYHSSRYAAQLAAEWQVPLLRVQHHHAHAASLMAECGCSEPVLAVVCDGIGYGPDGAIWGGELLLASLTGMRRLAHLRPLDLAGGDAAAIDTRRCALALVQQFAGEDLADHPLATELYPAAEDRMLLASMLRRGTQCVRSSAAGRYFDGFAALLGVCRENRFEAEAAVRLEAEAERATAVLDEGPLFALRRSACDPAGTELDLSPLSRRVWDLRRRGASTANLALLIHRQLAEAWEAAVVTAAELTRSDRVALTGGVFCNRVLSDLLSRRLAERGLQVLRHALAPCNDGGLSLGQAAIAAARLHEDTEGVGLDADFVPLGTTASEMHHVESSLLSPKDRESCVWPCPQN